jgi:hypothetical protein
VSFEAQAVRMVERTVRTIDLRTVRVPEGIDPGVAYRLAETPGAMEGD